MTNFHNEIIEMILFDAIKSSKYSTETYEDEDVLRSSEMKMRFSRIFT